MLSFTRHSQSQFEGATTVPAAALRARPALSFQVKSDRPIPSGAKRYESHLTSLAIEYLCRWSVAMPSDLRFGDIDAEESAFYAAIGEADLEQRARLLANSQPAAPGNAEDASALLEQMRAHCMVAPHNCCQSPLLHDWSRDLSSKKVFDVSQRARVVVHYAHPCGKCGRQVKPLTSEEAGRRGEKPVEQRETLGSDIDTASARSPIVNALMSELMEKHRSLRNKQPSSAVASKIERTCAERDQQRERLAAQEHLERQKQVAQAQREYKSACDKMIAKATLAVDHSSGAQRDSGNGSGSDSTSCGSSGVCGQVASSSDVSTTEGSIASTSDDFSSSSATFSDEKPLQPRSYADVVRSAATGPVHTQPSVNESALESSGTDSSESESLESDCVPPPPPPPELPSESSVQEENVAGEIAESAEPGQDAEEAQSNEEVDQKPSKGFAIRQTSFEAMVPICESDDTLATFDKMECEYVLQWAQRATGASNSAPRTKIHLFRRQNVLETAYFGLSSTKKSVYHLIVSIEIV